MPTRSQQSGTRRFARLQNLSDATGRAESTRGPGKSQIKTSRTGLREVIATVSDRIGRRRQTRGRDLVPDPFTMLLVGAWLLASLLPISGDPVDRFGIATNLAIALLFGLEPGLFSLWLINHPIYLGCSSSSCFRPRCSRSSHSPRMPGANCWGPTGQTASPASSEVRRRALAAGFPWRVSSSPAS